MIGDDLSIEEACRWQAEFCRNAGVPFTAVVADAAADCIAAGGPLFEVVKDWRGNPVAGAAPLRIVAAIQFAARASGGALGDLYAAMPNGPDKQSVCALIDRAAVEHGAAFADFFAKPVQTNEVNRTAALLGGFIEIAKETGMPLDLFEIGSSGGLLLGWDQYRYRFGGFEWGKPGRLEISAEWRGPAPDWPAAISVAGRRGCDINPVDYDDPRAVDRASCYLWPEQAGRRERFLAAIAATRRLGIKVEKADAGAWLAEKLASRKPDTVAVMFHSVMLQYLTPEARAAVEDAVAAAARAATAKEPFARLEFEPEPVDVSRFAVDLTLWPGGDKRRLAYAQAHAVWVEWLGA